MRNSVGVSATSEPSTFTRWLTRSISMPETATRSVADWAACGRRKQGLDAVDQWLELEGLGDVVVGPHVEADDLVDLFAAGGEHQHADALRFGVAAQLAADLQPVNYRKHEVEDHQFGQDERAHDSSPSRPSAARINLEALFGQVIRQDFDDRPLVLDEQDLLLHTGRT